MHTTDATPTMPDDVYDAIKTADEAHEMLLNGHDVHKAYLSFVEGIQKGAHAEIQRTCTDLYEAYKGSRDKTMRAIAIVHGEIARLLRGNTNADTALALRKVKSLADAARGALIKLEARYVDLETCSNTLETKLETKIKEDTKRNRNNFTRPRTKST